VAKRWAWSGGGVPAAAADAAPGETDAAPDGCGQRGERVAEARIGQTAFFRRAPRPRIGPRRRRRLCVPTRKHKNRQFSFSVNNEKNKQTNERIINSSQRRRGWSASEADRKAWTTDVIFEKKK